MEKQQVVSAADNSARNEQVSKFYYFDFLPTLYKNEDLVIEKNGGYGKKYYHEIEKGETLYRLHFHYDNRCGLHNFDFDYVDDVMSEEEFEKIATRYKRKIVREIQNNPISMKIDVSLEAINVVRDIQDGIDFGHKLEFTDVYEKHYVTRKRK